MALKRLAYIFIPVLSFFLMSHNVFAVDGNNWQASGVYGFNTNGGGITASPGAVLSYTTVYGNTLSAQLGPNNGSTVMSNFAFDMNGTIPANSILYFQVKICSTDNESFKFWGFNFRPDFAILSVELGDPSNNGGDYGYCQSYNYKLFMTQPNYALIGLESRMLTVYQLTNISISPVSWITLGSDANYSSALHSISDKQSQTNQKLDQLNNKVQQQQNAENQAIDNIDSQSPDDIEAGDNTNMVNFIGQISGIFTQIKDIPASSQCVIPGDFGNLDIGNINFCTGKEKMPFVVNFFSFIFVTLVSMGLAFYLVNRILSLYSWARSSSS